MRLPLLAGPRPAWQFASKLLTRTLCAPAPNLNVFTYTARAWRWSVFLATGRWPLTSPALGPDTFPTEKLTGHDVLYFKLHGLPKEPRWYGLEYANGKAIWQDAINVENIIFAPDLDGAIVFAQSCYAQQSPMVQALINAGASAVVGTSVKLKAGTWYPRHSDWIGRAFLSHLGRGASVQNAIHIATSNAQLSQSIDFSVSGDPERRFIT